LARALGQRFALRRCAPPANTGLAGGGRSQTTTLIRLGAVVASARSIALITPHNCSVRFAHIRNNVPLRVRTLATTPALRAGIVSGRDYTTGTTTALRCSRPALIHALDCSLRQTSRHCAARFTTRKRVVARAVGLSVVRLPHAPVSTARAVFAGVSNRVAYRRHPRRHVCPCGALLSLGAFAEWRGCCPALCLSGSRGTTALRHLRTVLNAPSTPLTPLPGGNRNKSRLNISSKIQPVVFQLHSAPTSANALVRVCKVLILQNNTNTIFF